MGTLVAYYSLTGNTKDVAESIAATCNGDIEKINDAKKRSGALAMFRLGGEAIFKTPALIQPVEKDPAEYDLVVLGTPVWAWTISSPMRSYIAQQASNFDRVAFFCTEGGTGGKRAFRHMSDLIGKQPVATLEVTESDLKNGADKDKLKSFIDAIAPFTDSASAHAA